MALTIVASYLVREGELEPVHHALRQMVEPTRAEPGCLGYDVFVDQNNERLIVLYERYEGPEAFQAHLDSAHFQTWLRAEVLPRLESRTRYELTPLESI